ncbi:MAG: right-handed parallel beta-helix repeat-containing protein, partial [bacterium]|nr:right-handed parallel beta-helix repeat-containing protein [bacterium]
FQESGSSSENWQDNNLIIVNGMDKDKNQIFGTPKAKNSVSYQPPITLPQRIDNRSVTLTTSYSPYIIQGQTIIGQNATLTINPGVVIKFMPKEGNIDSQLWILGALKAIGGQAESEKIVFTSFLDDEYGGDTNQDENITVPYPGAWKWILFGSPEQNINPTSDSELVNVLIRYGDADDVGVIKVEKGSSITIKNSRLEKNKRGIWLVSSPNTIIDGVEFVDNNFLAVEIQNGGSPIVKNSRFDGKESDQIGISVGAGTSPRIENNFFTKNKTPIIMYAGSVPILTGNRGENNQLNGIVISPSGGSYPEGVNQVTWVPNENFPYIIEDSWRVNSGITLKIEPGTVIKFGSLSPIYWNFRKDAYFEIQGTLEAEGTEGKPIIFTSLRDDNYGGDTNNDGLPRPEEQGPDWKGIIIKSQASATLKWLKIRYAGAGGNEPLTIEEEANVDQENIIIE